MDVVSESLSDTPESMPRNEVLMKARIMASIIVLFATSFHATAFAQSHEHERQSRRAIEGKSKDRSLTWVLRIDRLGFRLA